MSSESREHLIEVKETIAIQIVDSLVPHLDKIRDDYRLPRLVFVMFDDYAKNSQKLRQLSEAEFGSGT